MFDRRFFIIGNSRSGTTLLRLFLAAHSDVIVPPECGFIAWLYEKYGNWNQNDCRDDGKRAVFLQDLASAKKFDTWGLDLDSIDNAILAANPGNYADLCNLVCLEYQNLLQKKAAIIGDKNNFYVDYLDLLNSIYPVALFIHIVRDGRDVACSYREAMSLQSRSPYAPRLRTQLDLIAEEWLEKTSKVGGFLSGLPDYRNLTIRYEDLVLDPVEIGKELCDFLCIEYKPAMLDFYIENQVRQLEPSQTMGWKKRTLTPISADTVGRYKKKLTKPEIETFQRIAGNSLEKYGYELL